MAARYPPATPPTHAGVKRVWYQMLRFRVQSTPLSRATTWAAGAYSLLQGAGIIWGGNPRFSGVTYSIVREVPGGAYSWGVVAVILGMVILAGSVFHLWRVKAVGLLGMSGWSLSFAYGFLFATFTQPAAATTAGPAYGYICVTTAILVWVDERRDVE